MSQVFGPARWFGCLAPWAMTWVLGAGIHSGLLAAGTVKVCDAQSLHAALVGGGTITFECDGIIFPTNTILISTNTWLDATGREVELNGGQQRQIFRVFNGATLTMRNLKLAHGRAAGRTAGGHAIGGAIHVQGSKLTLIDCIFESNAALGAAGDAADPMATRGGDAAGGAIFCERGTVEARGCIFTNNIAEGGRGSDAPGGINIYAGGGGHAHGGAICVHDGILVLLGTELPHNSARAGEQGNGRPITGGGAAFGGAVYAFNSSLTIEASAFQNNISMGKTRVDGNNTGHAWGGAVCADLCQTAIGKTMFLSNEAHGGTGVGRSGVLARAADGSGGALATFGETIQISQSAFAGNLARGGSATLAGVNAQGGNAQGGAILNRSTMAITNCTLVTNYCQGGSVSVSYAGVAYGGGLYNQTGIVQLAHVTFSNNRAENGTYAGPAPAAPPRGTQLASAGTTFIRGSILSGSPTNENCFGSITDAGFNLSSDSSCNFTNFGSRMISNVMLGTAGYFGGRAVTVPLLPGSPAIDAISDPPFANGDQRGVPRGSRADIGAFEWKGELLMAVDSSTRGIRVLFAGSPQANARIEASVDLFGWLPWSSYTLTGEQPPEIAVTNRLEPARFFRLTR